MRKLALFIAVILFIIPFFWFKPGEMDLGGDSTRLYFYDPLSYLINHALYIVSLTGKNAVEPYFFSIPFVSLLWILKRLIHYPFLIMDLFNAIKLGVGFFSVYLIIKELLNKTKTNVAIYELCSIIGGLFYVFSPTISGAEWERALESHNQIFLNPLVFYLLLKYVLSHKNIYIWLMLFITLIFTGNFSWGSAPPFLAFYPLSLLFLGIYVILIRKKSLPIKGLIISFFIFIGLHAFDLIPSFFSMFDSGSVFSSAISTNRLSILGYFYGVLPLASLSRNILLVSPNNLSYFSPFFLVIVLGLLFKKKSEKTILFTGVFFLITVYFLSGKITHAGVKLYETLFLYVPTFSMFRFFISKWLFVFSFFYILFFSQALFFILSGISKKYSKFFYLIIFVLLILGGIPFLKGELVNKNHPYSNIKIPIIMDKNYETVISYIKSLKDDSKILILPFSDYNYQVIKGENGGGAYVGVSTINQLAGKSDFPGYFYLTPFSELFLKLAKNQDYNSIKKLLALLNIRYIYYNFDPKIYNKSYFPTYPYQYVRDYLPNDQESYKKFVDYLAEKQIFKIGSYSIYNVDSNIYLPHFYIANKIDSYENTVKDWYDKTESFFVSDTNTEIRTAYLEKEVCVKYLSGDICSNNEAVSNQPIPKIFFEKINSTKYKVKIVNAVKPYLLVFSDGFHKNWKLYLSDNTLKKEKITESYFNGDIMEGVHKQIFLDKNTFETWGKKSLADKNHFQVNGYANGWYIKPEDTEGKKDYELILEMTSQRMFYAGIGISLISFLVFLGWGLFIFIKDIGILKKRKNKK